MKDLFEFNPNCYGHIPLFMLPAAINIILAGFVALRLPGTRMNRIFTPFIFLLGVAQFADGMMHVSVTAEAAATWQKIAFAPWVFIAATGVIVILEYTRLFKWVDSGRHIAALALPAFLMEILIFSDGCSHTLVYSSTWGWIANPDNTGVNCLVYIYVSAVTLLMPVLLWTAFVRNRNDKIARRPFLLLSIGATIPYLGGFMSEVLFPLWLGLDKVPLTTPLMTVFSVCIYIAIKKYDLLEFSPRKQVDRIMDTVTEGVMMVDLNGNVMYTNGTFGKLLGYAPDELRGIHYTSLVNAESRTTLTSENTGSAELKLKAKSGTLIWAKASNSPCLNENGERIGTTFAVTDISELKKAHDELLIQKQLLQRAQSIAKVGHWQLNFATGKGLWSEETCRIYGVPVNECERNFEEWTSLIHPQDLATVLLKIEQSKDSYSDTDIEHRIVLADGTVKNIHSIVKYELDTDGNATGLYGVCQDITELTVAKESLRTSVGELETYIYKSSHDLHAPLSSILGLIDVSKHDLTDPVAVRYIGMIESQAKKLNMIRTQFIRAMQIKDSVRHDEIVRLRSLVEELIVGMHNHYGYARMKFNVNIAPDTVIYSNTFLLKTVLAHLIENAVRYQNHAIAQPFVNIDLMQTGNSSIIVVEDNGVGISPEIQDKIFDMYFKGTNSAEGSGLGLYLVKKAIEKLGGKVQLKSTPGQGTRFTLSFAQAN